MEPIEAIANAIIIQAVDDYHSYLRCYCLHSTNKNKEKVDELEAFFRSKWYGVLTTVDPEILLEKVRREVKREVMPA